MYWLLMISLSLFCVLSLPARHGRLHNRLFPKILGGKKVVPSAHVFFMPNVSVAPVIVDLSPEHNAYLEEQGIPTDSLKWIHNHTHFCDSPQYVYHSDFSSYGLIANRIDLSFKDWDWNKEESRFTADSYGLAFGISSGGGTCWFNYGAGWLADNHWGANAWSAGGGPSVGAMNVAFTGGSDESIGSCLYGIAGLQLSVINIGWGNFHH